MKPLDPRLLRRARAARVLLAVQGALGVLSTAAIVAFAWLVARLVTGVVDGDAALLLVAPAWALVAVVAARGLIAWLTDATGVGAAARVQSELRGELVRAIARLGPEWTAARRASDLTVLAGPGLQALDAYFAKYVPQLVLTAVATPVLLIVVLVVDAPSGIALACSLPLIPLFMALIGWATQKAQERQWSRLQELAGSFLEVVEGLSTLKIFRREQRQVERVCAATDEYRGVTMRVLRMSFLSSFALELIASLAVAIVAVSIGIRLLDRSMTLETGLFVLMLAPEVFLPLRQVGAQFHAAADGVQASKDVFEVLDAADAAAGAVAAGAASRASAELGRSGVGATKRASAPPPVQSSAGGAGEAASGLSLRGIIARYPDSPGPVLRGVDADFARGRVTAVTGESGAGKSTLIAAVRGRAGVHGERLLDGVPLGEAASARARIAWQGQDAGIVQGTVRDNVALGLPGAGDDDVRGALALAAFEIDPATPVDARGGGLSGGQAQRVAFARAILRARSLDCGVVLLDEPTSALDEDTERRVVAGMRALAREGRAVVVVSHRPAVVAAADARVRLEGGRVADAGDGAPPTAGAASVVAAVGPCHADAGKTGDEDGAPRGAIGPTAPVADPTVDAAGADAHGGVADAHGSVAGAHAAEQPRDGRPARSDPAS